MPRPVAARERYLPGLDGLRALAVIVVVGYHFRVPYLTGGLQGVGVFFTLSGFLITRLLLSTLAESGNLGLRQFWLARARRLLPALAAMISVVLAATALVTTGA